MITLQVFRLAFLLIRDSNTDTLKNICERLLLFVSLQNTITNNSDEFGLDETSTECKVSIFLYVTILFNLMHPYNLHAS